MKFLIAIPGFVPVEVWGVEVTASKAPHIQLQYFLGTQKDETRILSSTDMNNDRFHYWILYKYFVEKLWRVPSVVELTEDVQ